MNEATIINQLKRYIDNPTHTGNGVTLDQKTLFDIVASEEMPYMIDFEISTDEKFKMLPIDVLIIKPSSEDIVNILATFDSVNEADFEHNDYIKFDKILSLKKECSVDATKTKYIKNKALYEIPLDAKFMPLDKNLENVISMEAI